MSFMRPEIWQDSYHLIQDKTGTYVYDSSHGFPDGETDPEVIAEYLDCDPSELGEIEYVSSGWLYRLSAPGYMDCTDTGWADTEGEAIQELLNMYGNECGDPEDWEADCRERLKEISSDSNS